MSIFRSRLQNSTERKKLLTRVAALFAQKASRVVFEIGTDRFNAKDASNVAFDPNAGSANVVLTRPSGGVKASLVLQDLTYTAVAGGTGGNLITIEYLDTGTAGAEVASHVGNAISVSMESGVSTAQQIKAAIEAVPAVAALVTVAISGTASNAQTAVSATALTGGLNVESYDYADLELIKRLRTKKYLIKIKGNSNPA